MQWPKRVQLLPALSQASERPFFALIRKSRPSFIAIPHERPTNTNTVTLPTSTTW